jgi:hypothetical protein
MNVYMSNDSKFGHNRTQKNEPKRAVAISRSLAKKSTRIITKAIGRWSTVVKAVTV